MVSRRAGRRALDQVAIDTLSIPQSVRGGRTLQAWIDRQRRIFGLNTVSLDVLQQEAVRACQQLRSQKPAPDHRLVGMTIHQAKNREFDRVILLWPYEVSGLPEKLRRLLYNGITRARERATIIVQNPPTSRPSRLKMAPFATS